MSTTQVIEQQFGHTVGRVLDDGIKLSEEQKLLGLKSLCSKLGALGHAPSNSVVASWEQVFFYQD